MVPEGTDRAGNNNPKDNKTIQKGNQHIGQGIVSTQVLVNANGTTNSFRNQQKDLRLKGQQQKLNVPIQN